VQVVCGELAADKVLGFRMRGGLIGVDVKGGGESAMRVDHGGRGVRWCSCCWPRMGHEAIWPTAEVGVLVMDRRLLRHNFFETRPPFIKPR
jgi:hypothetical protein